MRVNPHFSQGFGRFAYSEAVQRAVDTRRAIEGFAGILEQYVEKPDWSARVKTTRTR